MAADTLSSASITNLDSFPVVANTAGVGATADMKEVSDYVTPTTGGLASTGSKYKLVRLPTYAKVKDLTLAADGALDTNGTPTLAVDVGAYWSDSTVDGTPANLQGTVISANCFAAAVAFGAAGNLKLSADSAWSVANRNLPLWVALGISAGPTGSPPGGFIDVVLAVHTAAATAASQKTGIRVTHVA